MGDYNSRVAQLKDKIETALNETRILILGGQVLIGFNYRSFFEPGFEKLTPLSQILLTVSLGLMLLGLGPLLLPPPYHRIVERGRISDQMHAMLMWVLAIGLLPFALALGADMFAVGELVGGTILAAVAGTVSLLAALLAWYALGVRAKMAHQARNNGGPKMPNQKNDEQPSLTEKVKEVLIEARMVLPGAQALLGFQFIIVLMEGFNRIPASSRYIHFASLAAIALSTILLITPAAYHRIVYHGEDNEDFPVIASRLLLAAMIFVALGVSGDFYVVCRIVSGSLVLSFASAAGMLLFFYGLWFGWTAYKRRAAAPQH